MTRKTIIVAVIVLVLGAAAIAFGVVLFQGQDDQPVAEQPPQQEVQQLTENEKTALEAATIMTTWHPADDFNRTDAELRASHLMTDERASTVESPVRGASGPEWREAAQHSATSEPHVTVNYHTDNQEGIVSVRASWEWVTENGEILASSNEERIYYFSFNEEGEIHDYTYETIRQHKQSENEE
jgi:hypothetical protein